MFTLGRKIDINYPTNRRILLISLLVAGIGWFTTGKPMSGAYIGVGTFLTWVVSRELDPGHEDSAFLAVAFSSIRFVKRVPLLCFSSVGEVHMSVITGVITYGIGYKFLLKKTE